MTASEHVSKPAPWSSLSSFSTGYWQWLVIQSFHYWHWPQSMWSRFYGKLRCPSVSLSVPASAACSRFAAVARQVCMRRAGSVTSSAYVVSWNTSCVHEPKRSPASSVRPDVWSVSVLSCRDSIDNTLKEKSTVFSLIRMIWLCQQGHVTSKTAPTKSSTS